MITVKLSEDEGRRLEETFHTTPDRRLRDRCQAILMAARGRRHRQIAAELARKHVHLQVLDQHLDTSDATGRLLFHMLGAIAQFETELRAERQMDGIQKARARGVHLGRKKRLTPQLCTVLRQRRLDGALITTLMHEYHLSKASIYRYLGGIGDRQRTV